jgi:hypothetical protein
MDFRVAGLPAHRVRCLGLFFVRSGAKSVAGGNGTAWKLVLSVLVVMGAVGFLLFRSIREGARYYRHVDEVMASPDSFRNKRLQVHGTVASGSIEQVKGREERIGVVYGNPETTTGGNALGVPGAASPGAAVAAA